MSHKHPTVEASSSASCDAFAGGQVAAREEGLADSSTTLRQAPDVFASVTDRTLPSVTDPDYEPDDLAPVTMPCAGDIVGGTYRVIDELGRGAMGVVLVGEDQQLARKVAIKLVRPELLEPGFHQLFLEEARAMARVNHPNVVSVHAFGMHGRTPYFVMELVEGKTMDAWLAERTQPIDLDLALRILNDLCSGVSAIHAAGTVHRDIKPGNILVDAKLRVQITDFGVSTRYREDGSSKSEVVGTPAYMAPEIASASSQSGPPTPRADVYSLGCVAYELITGRPPFELSDQPTMMVRHATEPVPLPSTFRSELPRAFDQVLLHALAKRPAERTASVELLRRGLLEARRHSLEPVRILVAEDDDDFRELLAYKLALEFPDAEIITAVDGRAALAALETKGTPSAAILDLQMPFLDGLSLTAELRAREECRAMPIIVLTASGGPKEWQRLSNMGVDRFMVKPVNLDDIVTVLRSAIRERASSAA
jgi:serine/threonine-protein kinase